jgi:hypothetical protein
VTQVHEIPAVDGVLTREQVATTAATIADMQEPDGAVPWSVGEHVDVWNHVEAAMALDVAGQSPAATAAYEWCLRWQRHDGSWPMKIVAGQVEDASGETNMCAYLAVGLWHHWLLHRDLAFTERLWPAVRRGLDFVVGMQLPFGGIAWSQEWDEHGPARVNREALLAGSSSIYQSLRAGVALADLVGEPQPEWELAGGRLGHALRNHRDLFLDKTTFAMDWYYPVLGGAVRGGAGLELIQGRWPEFVMPGLGVRCVETNPWVTGAETCELVMALDSLDDPRAREVYADIQHLRHGNGSYWTGSVHDPAEEGEDGKGVFWPGEQTTYTAAAVVLAADALSRTSPASGIMRGDTLASHFRAIALECGCSDEASGLSADVVAGGA